VYSGIVPVGHGFVKVIEPPVATPSIQELSSVRGAGKRKNPSAPIIGPVF